MTNSINKSLERNNKIFCFLSLIAWAQQWFQKKNIIIWSDLRQWIYWTPFFIMQIQKHAFQHNQFTVISWPINYVVGAFSRTFHNLFFYLLFLISFFCSLPFHYSHFPQSSLLFIPLKLMTNKKLTIFVVFAGNFISLCHAFLHISKRRSQGWKYSVIIVFYSQHISNCINSTWK